MQFRGAGSWLTVFGLALGCGQAAERTEEEPGIAQPISGLYKVSGETITTESGHRREIAGSVTLSESGDGTYTASFHLKTTYPGADEALPADVVGTGEGEVEGRTLTGTADTQLVMATVPGIDPGFAFVPRMVSTRLRSSSVAVIERNGSVDIEIANEGAPGQEYAATRTTLRGHRVGASGAGGRTETAE